MNAKVLYAAGGGIAAAAVALFFIIGPANIKLPGLPGDQTSGSAQPLDLVLTLKNVIAQQTTEKNATVQITFNAYNPNRNTAILETVHYTIYVDDIRMTSGDIGVSPQGFVASQGGIFPIVANSTVALKDSRTAVKSNLTAAAWDQMVAGAAQYRVDGTYAYKLTGTGFQFTAGEKEFSMTFP